MTNKGLINQIPQAVSQAVQPLVEQAANDISSTLGSGNLSSNALYQQPSGTSLTSSSNMNDTPIQPRPGNNRPMLNNTGGGMIFDQYRNPGNMGRFISPSEMTARDPSYAYAPPTQLFAEGGMATQAQNLASRGRGEDKMLVHMTPSEVQGLQALAMAQGGSLTINPETGLPEAGFLSDTFKALAPTIIGAGLTYFSGGAINPYMAAGIVGVGEGIRKDDIGAGLMAGLGAYGGAGAVKGLAGMGAAQASQGFSGAVDPKALSELGGGMVKNTATAGGTNALGIAQGGVDSSLMGGNIVGSASTPGAGTTGSLFNSNYGPATTAVNAAPVEMIKPATVTSAGTATNPLTGEVVGSPNLVQNLDGTVTNYANPYGVGITENPITTESIAQTAAERTRLGLPEYAPSFRQNIDTGIARLGEKGGLTAFKDSYVNAMGGPKRALLGGAGVLGSVADGYGAFDYKPMELAEAETDDYGYEGPYLPAERNVRFRGRDAILGGEGREFKFFDPVNPVPNVRTAAHGGLMSAKKMAVGGRYLDGPGDGVSDSIPATVDGEQPVMLSEGEYIIPAEVVSAVGNGSSDAGADKFTALVDTIMAKTRKVAKGKPNGADKLLKGLIPQTA